MATYKAECLSHYYKARLRTRAAYAFGLIHWWARLAQPVSGLVNLITHAPGLRTLAKIAAGMPREREFPRFAREAFTHWFRRRRPQNNSAPAVLLWPDTFNNHFHPETAVAAVEVLEGAGYRVEIPSRTLCCGRPLYDYGMLDLAKRQLRMILEALQTPIRQGTPIVGLEPSCMAVFRDELKNLFPHDEDARRLSGQSFLMCEFIGLHPERFQIPTLGRKALVHGHCHHKAVLRFESNKHLLEQLGLDVDVLDAGCCGMAGSFGFEKNKYEISMRVGERVLLPAIRNAAEDTLIIADGFSCREQIAQTTGRRAVHSAEVLRMAATRSSA